MHHPRISTPSVVHAIPRASVVAQPPSRRTLCSVKCVSVAAVLEHPSDEAQLVTSPYNYSSSRGDLRDAQQQLMCIEEHSRRRTTYSNECTPDYLAHSVGQISSQRAQLAKPRIWKTRWSVCQSNIESLPPRTTSSQPAPHTQEGTAHHHGADTAQAGDSTAFSSQNPLLGESQFPTQDCETPKEQPPLIQYSRPSKSYTPPKQKRNPTFTRDINELAARIDAGAILTRDELYHYTNYFPRNLRIDLNPNHVVHLFQNNRLDAHTLRKSSTFQLNAGVKLLCVRNQIVTARRLVQHLHSMAKSNQHTFATLLNSFADNGDLMMVKHQYNLWAEMGLIEDMGHASVSVLLKCVSRRDFGHVPETLEMLDELGAPINTASYNSLFHVCADMGLFTEGWELLGAMLDSRRPVHPDAYTFQSILLAAETSGNMERLPEIVRQMESLNVVPDSRLAAYIVKAYSSRGDVDSAGKVFLLDMPRWDVHADVYHFNALLLAFTSTGDWRSAIDVYRRMLEKDCKPDAYTFVALFTSMARSNDAVWPIVSQTIADQASHTIRTTSYIGTAVISSIRSCCDLPLDMRVHHALSTFEAVLSDGHGDAEVFNSIITMHAAFGDPHAALSIYRRMIALEVLPSDRTYTLLIGMCQEHGLFHEVTSFQELRVTMTCLMGSKFSNP